MLRINATLSKTMASKFSLESQYTEEGGFVLAFSFLFLSHRGRRRTSQGRKNHRLFYDCKISGNLFSLRLNGEAMIQLSMILNT